MPCRIHLKITKNQQNKWLSCIYDTLISTGNSIWIDQLYSNSIFFSFLLFVRFLIFINEKKRYSGYIKTGETVISTVCNMALTSKWKCPQSHGRCILSEPINMNRAKYLLVWEKYKHAKYIGVYVSDWLTFFPKKVIMR